jgi:hypothetical protein
MLQLKIKEFNVVHKLPTYWCFAVMTKSKPWSLARSERHLQYMNGRHTRNKRVMKRGSNAVMTRECYANAVRMLRGWLLWQFQLSCFHADVVQMQRVSYAQHTSSKCDVNALHMRDIRAANAMQKTWRMRALQALHPTCEARFIAWVTFGQYCMPDPF